MQGQGQGPSLQGPGQGQGLDLRGQGQGLTSLVIDIARVIHMSVKKNQIRK